MYSGLKPAEVTSLYGISIEYDNISAQQLRSNLLYHSR